MKKNILGLMTAVILVSHGISYAGSMGDMTTKSWTGFYLGANGGAGWGDPSVSMTYLENGQTEQGISWYPTSVGQHYSGAVFGGQIGYNYQISSQWVLGLKYDTDFSQWTAYNATRSGDSSGANAVLYSSQKLNWFGHLLPRAGYLIKNNLLAYGTGGLSFGSVRGYANQAFSSSLVGVNSYPGSFKTTSAGWAAGGGLEWNMVDNWSLAVEYLYNDLGSHTAIANETFPSGAVSAVLQNKYVFNSKFQTLALAVNYHW